MFIADDPAVEDYASDSDDEDYVPIRDSSEVSDCEESVENRESEVESDEDDDELTESVPTSGESSQLTTTFTAKDNTI
ncbi:hypothetical protein M0802_011949 [Mischocyttarus mexicanus]|nr:hypothetical protein M0802_011949 [Mischocyttarus mexicanus]